MTAKHLYSARLLARKEAVLHRSRASGRSPAQPRFHRRFGRIAAIAATVGLVGTGLVSGVSGTAGAAGAPTGSGFTVTTSDLAFILKQIKIAERHAATLTPDNPCGTLVGGAPDQIPDRLSAYGLRTVDGSCNDLFPGRENFAAADQQFPRLTSPVFRNAEPVPPGFGPPGPTSYKQKKGLVFDSQPRVISNLIVDQTATNPAAIAAAFTPVRSQGNPSSAVPCETQPSTPGGADGVPLGCTPKYQTLFIPNVTTDVGLSPPYNSMFTFFGQFFDHGVDQTVKSGGTVFVPLKSDDPLIAGPDHILGNDDDLPSNMQFMVLTRAQNQKGPDGILGDDPATPEDESADDVQNANNTDSPWVDQSQTYTSHSSHQVFLREYVMNGANRPVSTGKLLGGLGPNETYNGSPDGRTGIGTWAAVKLQARTKLGLLLHDTDVTNIPLLATDPYGKFLPGPNGLPQYVTKSGLVEGNLGIPVSVPSDALHFDTPFLTDIAHNADPGTVGPCTDTGGATGCLNPDSDDTPSADFGSQPAGTYDDEMLNAHFSCGDGRCNENIALSTIHQIFHSEHDRLVDDIKNTLTNDTSASGVAALAQWKPSTAAVTPDGWNGERLFQAARFVTEMEYQHLVFEEFARKMQPAIRPFHVYNPDLNAAIPAEFAHAVYRFGHSMLDDQVARSGPDADPNGTLVDHSLPLLNAFLNPPEFFKAGSATLTPEQGAGAIVMGSADQVGNELDEFVVETLRNNLLGLPLDLPTLNMTRARDAGIPPLNDVRRQIFAQTNDGQMAPYTSWSDFGQHLKHPESLINFVAAYGTHPSITSQTTAAGKRAAAKLIVDPADPTNPLIPTDAAEFMFGSGGWASDADGVTNTGLDSVDLWVGGLAEITNLFGGLLGTTFNYVFETSLENLQDFDRFYYLNRTPGMNLRTQLEGNSFSELIQRNTDGTNTLKADAFATADCKFQLANLAGTAAGFASFGSTVKDDPSTVDCNESLLLLRQPIGTIQYRQFNTVDPSGINGQSVYNGTDGNDRVFGGNDNDTFWGGLGNDTIEGNGGDDVALGGDGNDILTDLGGADVQKGGPGNDAIDGGIGDDIPMGGDGQDFINGGANDNEAFAGPGNDFIIAGQGADAAFGDGGDDWIEGGTGQDLLIGDHGAPFFDDPAQVAPGNDVFVGQAGENDYDAEGGDDVMSQNAAVDRNAGAGGFDWAFHQYDTVGADDDMEINNNLVGAPIQVVVNRDRWQETEADSGSAFADIIKGTSVAPSSIGGAGFTGCDAIDQAGLNRISGLDPLVPALTTDAAPIAAASAPGQCPLSGPVWGAGDILLGGLGSDTITGRGADDIMDGDRSLQVRISVRTDPANPATQIGSADLMEHQYLRDAAGNLTGPTLQAAVFAGTVDPGNLVAVREIIAPAAGPGDCGATVPVNCDTAEFSGPRASYTIAVAASAAPNTTNNRGGTLSSVRVTDNRAVRPDGIDTLRNFEQLSFCPTPGVVRGTCDAPRTFVLLAPVIAVSPTTGLTAFASTAVNGTSAARTVTVSNTGFADLTVSPTVIGTDAASFSLANGCTAPVAPGGTPCVLSVTFKPTTTGLKTATLSISSNGSATPKTFTLTGTGVDPVITFTPSPVNFGTVNVGNNATQNIVVRNTGSATITTGAATLGGANATQFTITNATNTCVTGRSLTANQTCTITVRFNPTGTTSADAGSRTATLTVPSSTGTTFSTTLNGTAATPPTIGVANVAFGRHPVNSTTTTTATVTNTGIDQLNISSVTIAAGATSAAFTVSLGTCNALIDSHATCQLLVTFHPTVAATFAGTVTITSNASNNPRTFTLSGRAP